MIVKRAIQIMQDLDKYIEILNQTDDNGSVTIPQHLAMDLVCVCEDYKSVIKGSEVMISFCPLEVKLKELDNE